MDGTSDSNQIPEQNVIQIEEEIGDVCKNNNDDEKEKEAHDAVRYYTEGEHVINMLTERQPDSIVRQGRRREYMVYQLIKAAPPESPPITSYSDGDRNDFVRLVFILVLLMVLVTFIFTCVVYNSDDLQEKMRSVTGIIILVCCLIITMIVNYIFCCSSCARALPCNYVLLILATGAYSYICAFIAAYFDRNIVLGAVLITLIITALCLGLAFTSFDFTKFLLVVVVASVAVCLAFLFVGVLAVFFNIKLTFLRLALLVISTLISSLCMIIEFQMILGGKSIELGEDDYAYGAFLVYTSIIELFLNILQICNECIDLDDVI